MRTELLICLAAMRDDGVRASRLPSGDYDAHNASDKPEVAAFRAAWEAAALTPRELRVWRRVPVGLSR